MPYYKDHNQKEIFRSWLQEQAELIAVAIQEGFSEEEAYELLKMWELAKLADTLRYR